MDSHAVQRKPIFQWCDTSIATHIYTHLDNKGDSIRLHRVHGAFTEIRKDLPLIFNKNFKVSFSIIINYFIVKTSILLPLVWNINFVFFFFHFVCNKLQEGK